MAANKHTFPQNGDYDDAENFAQLVGQSNLVDFVSRGLALSPDYAVPEVAISDGIAFVHQDSGSAATTGETRLDLGYVVQIPATTLSLADADVNYIYVEPNLGTNNNPTVVAYTAESSASTTALKIGEVDTGTDTVTETNRRPELDASSITLSEDAVDRYVFDYDPANGRLSLMSSDVDGSGTDGAVFHIPDGTADLVDATSNVIYDQVNNWVPADRIEQGSGSGLDADTVDGLDSSDFPRLKDGVQAPVFASLSDVPSSITVGELVYVEGDGLYVEDGT